MRARTRKDWLIPAVILLVTTGLGWAAFRLGEAYPGGEHFIGLWSGGRAFLTEGLSPYSEEVQQQVGEAVRDWGRQPEASRNLFSYPFYALLPALPFVLVSDYSLARLLWAMAGITGLLLTCLAAVRLSGWRPKALSLGAALLFVLFNPYTVTALVTGNLALLTLLLIASALLAVRGGLDELGGLALALATITPQLALPLLGFVSVWAVSQRRDQLLLWTWGGVGLMIAGSWLAHGAWMTGYIQTLGQLYWLEGIYTPGQALRSWWPGFGAQMGWTLTVLLGLLLLNEWRLAFGKGERWMTWTAGLTLAAGGLLGLRTEPASLVVALLPLLLVVGWWDERWGGRYGWTSAVILLGLLGALWRLAPRGVVELAYPGITPQLYFALPIFTILGLYWVRWLALKPRGTLLDELRQGGEI